MDGKLRANDRQLSQTKWAGFLLIHQHFDNALLRPRTFAPLHFHLLTGFLALDWVPVGDVFAERIAGPRHMWAHVTRILDVLMCFKMNTQIVLITELFFADRTCGIALALRRGQSFGKSRYHVAKAVIATAAARIVWLWALHFLNKTKKFDHYCKFTKRLAIFLLFSSGKGTNYVRCLGGKYHQISEKNWKMMKFF